MTQEDETQKHITAIKRQRSVLFADEDPLLANEDPRSNQAYVDTKLHQDEAFTQLPRYLADKIEAASHKKKRSVLTRVQQGKNTALEIDAEVVEIGDKSTTEAIALAQTPDAQGAGESHALVIAEKKKTSGLFENRNNGSRELQLFHQEREEAAFKLTKPEWHAPWKLMRVVAGHAGWVRSVAMDPENQWFATGSADRTIKVWDLASAKLKLTLTGHIMAVRGIVISPRHPYMFSCSEDKSVKCWDLEKNRVIRDYHGHLSSVYTVDMHPTHDIIATGGRDSSVRLWDIRTRVPIHVLTGHDLSVTNVRFQATQPQLLSTSMDGTIRTYDIVAGKTRQVLTHHRKAVRGVAVHEVENSFASASSDAIKQWKFPDCQFLQDFEPRHDAAVNTLSVNQSNVLFSGADDGSISFFDWKSGHKFQATNTTKMPGSSESENGIYCSTFDRSGSRLITGESDKSIKFWKEDPDATPETHPGIEWNPMVQRDAI